MVRVFLSCVSSEFRGYRMLLTQQLSTAKLEPVDQEHFADRDGLVLELLDEKIRSCEYVVHWIGKSTGFKPKEDELDKFLTNPKFPERAKLLGNLGLNKYSPDVLCNISYTQWEFWLGLFHGCQRLVYKVRPDANREKDFQPNAAEEEEQKQHIERIRQAHQMRYDVENEWNLSTRVMVSLIHNRDVVLAESQHRPTIVLGLFPTGKKEYLSQGAIRWKGHGFRIAGDEPLDVNNAKAVCTRLTDLIGRCHTSFSHEELDYKRIVIELCLPEELLTKELSHWTHIPEGMERFGSCPIREHHPVRVRWIERAKAQASQKRIIGRLRVLDLHADTLHSICDEVPLAMRGILNPQPLGLIRSSDKPASHHWKAESVVCGGFLQPPIRLKRRPTKPTRTLTEWQLAVMLEGVPYLIWPDEPQDVNRIDAYLRETGVVSSMCIRLEGQPVVVFAESDSPPFDDDWKYISEVQS